MLPGISSIVVSLVGGYILWLGLSVLVQQTSLSNYKSLKLSVRQMSSVYAGLSLTLASWFLFGVIMRSLVLDNYMLILWQRATGWAVPVAAACWFRAIAVSIDFANEKKLSIRLNTLSILLLSIGLLLGMGQAFTSWLFNYPDMLRANLVEAYSILPVTPQIYFYDLFLLMTLGGILCLLCIRYQREINKKSLKRNHILSGTGCLLLTITAIMELLEHINPGIFPLPLRILVCITGLILICGALVRQRDMLGKFSDTLNFSRSFATFTLLVLICLAVYYGVHTINKEPLTPTAMLLLIFLVASTFAISSRTQQERIKNVFPTALEMISEDTDRNLSSQIKYTQNAQIRNVIEEEVYVIFRHKTFHKTEVMASSRLFTLKIVQESLNDFARQNYLTPECVSEGERARVLQNFLEQFVKEKFCPGFGVCPSHPPSDRWIEYVILWEGYIEGRTRQEVIREIHKTCGIWLAQPGGVGGRVYTQYLASARYKLAQLIWQENMRNSTAETSK